MSGLYLNAQQTQLAPATQFEHLLGDSIERAYAAGLTELPALITYLNQAGPSCPSHTIWTEALFCEQMARLGK